jgi:hypothetical protein
MTELPNWARKSCPKCGARVAYVLTPRRSKGLPVEIMIDWEHDPGEGGIVVAQVINEVVYGDAVVKSKAAAMRAAGQQLHALHKETCVKRSTSRKRP